MVNEDDLPVGTDQKVSGIAIGIVDESVEHVHASELFRPLVRSGGPAFDILEQFAIVDPEL